MLHPCRKPLSWMILVVMVASILMRDGDAVSLRGRELEMKCTCNPCGVPCEYPSPPPPSPPEWVPPPPPPSPPLPPPEPTGPPQPLCPPPPKPVPYTPTNPPYWFSPPGILYPVDPGYHPNGAGRSSIGWLPVLVGGGLLALWL